MHLFINTFKSKYRRAVQEVLCASNTCFLLFRCLQTQAIFTEVESIINCLYTSIKNQTSELATLSVSKNLFFCCCLTHIFTFRWYQVWAEYFQIRMLKSRPVFTKLCPRIQGNWNSTWTSVLLLWENVKIMTITQFFIISDLIDIIHISADAREIHDQPNLTDFCEFP